MSQEPSLAIGGLGLAASAPDVLYAATGEWTAAVGWGADPMVNGAGVFRTVNGGDSWDPCGPIDSLLCAAVAVDPTNESRVFVAGDAGLHHSTNGGETWATLFEGTISDVVVDPADVQRVYFGVHKDGLYVWDERQSWDGQHWHRLEDHVAVGDAAIAPKIALGRLGTHGSRFVAVKMGSRISTSTAKTVTLRGSIPTRTPGKPFSTIRFPRRSPP